jgi:outer membrane immunogenic protein
MNHNKIIIIAALVLGAQISVAGSMGEIESSLITQPGFYIAGDIGASNLINNESHTVNAETHQLGAVGLVGGGFIGYDFRVLENVMLGLEAFADANALNMDIQHFNNSYKMNSTYNLGVRVLPSYVFTPFTLGHVILGYTNDHFNIRDNGVYGYINSSFNQSGFQGGLGFTTTARKNVFVRLDGIYSIYASKSSTGLGLTTATPYQYYNNQFSTLMGELSLIYKFG